MAPPPSRTDQNILPRVKVPGNNQASIALLTYIQ